MSESAFDLASFCAQAHATPRECHAFTMDLVRGLKDYYEARHGYDVYGAETIFHVPRAMGIPLVYGFGMLRVLRDRRLSVSIKCRAAERAVDAVTFGDDRGLPHGLFASLLFLGHQSRLSLGDLRYGLLVSEGIDDPFRGLTKTEALSFLRCVIGFTEMPDSERLLMAHSLIVRHDDRVGSSEMIGELLGAQNLPVDLRLELCQAWTHFRQPRLAVDVPQADSSPRSLFVAENLPFWIAHSRSWPTKKMMLHGVFWLTRLGADPLETARTYIAYRGVNQEQAHAAVAEILMEHATAMPSAEVKVIIEHGITLSGESGTRRRFFQLGTRMFGEEYLSRAGLDPANSVRQWAVQQGGRASVP